MNAIPFGCIALVVTCGLAGCQDTNPMQDSSGAVAAPVTPDIARIVRQESTAGTILVKTHTGHEVINGSIGAGGVTVTVDGNASGILLEGAWRLRQSTELTWAEDLDLILTTLSLPACSGVDVGCDIRPATQHLEDNDGYYRNSNGMSVVNIDSPSRIRLEGADLAEITELCGDSCEWDGFFGAKGAAADLDWYLVMTIFEGGVMPHDFTALPAEWLP